MAKLVRSAITLSSGYSMPQLGLGTWLAKPGEVGNAVDIAVRNGYRHIDCAVSYQNQPEIGLVFEKLFKEGVVKRDELFITSKIWNTYHSHNKAKQCVDMILGELKLDYLDLCLIHWPVGYTEDTKELFPKDSNGHMLYSDVHFTETWCALEECVKEGKVRSIGLSNFNHKQILEVIGAAYIKPAALQVELHPYFQQKKLRSFCDEHNVAVTAYSPLGNPAMPFRKDGDPTILHDELFLSLGMKYNKSPAQIALRWSTQNGIIVIPKSISEKRIQENANIFDFELTSDEIEQINLGDRNWRILDTLNRDGDHPLWSFKEDF